MPGAEIGSGSLGHGLPIAVGRALAGRRVYVLVGDGELDEGSNWEAVQYAGRIGLDTLTVVVIDNESSTYRWPGGIEQRFALEGWDAVRVDGRDHDAVERALGGDQGRTTRLRRGGARGMSMRERFYELAVDALWNDSRAPSSSPTSAPRRSPTIRAASTSASASS